MNHFNFGFDHLTVSQAISIMNGSSQGIISAEAKSRISKSREAVEWITENEATVYGINTGFGPLCSTKISPEETSVSIG